MWLAVALVMAGSALDLRVPLLKHQRAFMQHRTGVTALTGGYGSGKSTSCAIKALTHTAEDPGILHAVCSPSFPMAKLTIIPSIYEVLEDWMGLVENRDFKYNKSDHRFDIWTWGGNLVVLSGEEPKRLKGPNLGSFGIDEPGLQTHEVFKQAKARVRHPRARFREVYLTGTPEDINWYADLVEGDLKPEGLVDIRAHSRDNFFLPEEYFRGLEESYTEQEVAAYLAGQFVSLNNAMAYHAFSTENVIEAAEFGEPDPELPLLLGFDYNWSPNTAVVAQEVPDWVAAEGAEPTKRLVVFDEFHLTNCSTEAKCQRILEKYGTDFHYKIYQDASGDGRHAHGVGVSDLNIVRNAFKETAHQVLFRGANPKRIDRMNAVNGRMRNALGERFVLITKNCKHLIEDLRKCTRDEYLNGHFKDKARGHMTDCLGYMVEFRYPILRKVRHSNKALNL